MSRAIRGTNTASSRRCWSANRRATRANKTIELKVLLSDADPDYPKEDRSAVDGFPATRDDLFNQYDLVILGDVDPRHPKLGEKHLQWLADFVREKGRRPAR